MKPSSKIPPKPRKDTIYIDVDDEITSIIDKVDGAKEKVVALVLPKRATVLQSVVNMRLLKRSSEKANKSVVLITSEEALIPLAGAAGLHVAKNLQSTPAIPSSPTGKAPESAAGKETPALLSGELEEEPSTKLDYHRTVGELATAHAEDEAIDLDDEDAEEAEKPKAAKAAKTPKNKKIKVPNFDRFRVLLFGGGALLILLIVFVILALFVLPKATITIQTQSTPVTADLTLNADSSFKTLDETNDNIPAVVKTTNQTATQSVSATGQQNNGTQATGEVTMTAEECGTPTPAADVPAGTGVSAGGLTYITQNDTSFNPTQIKNGCIYFGASGPTDITAQTGGSNYNTGSGTSFTVDGRSDVSASGSASGGTDDIITVVSQNDVNNAAAKLTNASSSSFTSNFENQLASQGLYVLTTTLKASAPATTANPAVGQQASSTTVTTQITYTVLAVEKSDLTKVLTDALDSKIEPGKQKLSTTNILGAATVTVQNQASPTSATLSVDETTTAIPTLDITSIKQQSTGQKIGDIQSAISGLPGVKSVSVKLSPFWVSKAPKVSKITVVEQQVQNGGG